MLICVGGVMFRKILGKAFQNTRVCFYWLLSKPRVRAVSKQPILVCGNGNIDIHSSVIFGVESSPGFYSGYSYIESRHKDSVVKIGEGTIINNNLKIISDNKKITIGSRCLIGFNFQVLNSNFHDLDPERRFNSRIIHQGDVEIGNNVFIGNNVTVLKGVHIGRNSVIANGSVIVKSVPENSIVGGNPAIMIGSV